MGLPEINIIFKTKGLTAIQRSERGIVAVILKDDTEGGKSLGVYNSILDVDFSAFTQRNYEYLKLLYEGGPSKVIILKVAADTEDLAPSLKKLASLKWNYLTVPGLTDDEKTVLSAWINGIYFRRNPGSHQRPPAESNQHDRRDLQYGQCAGGRAGTGAHPQYGD